MCVLQPQVAVALMQQMGVREDLPVNDQARGFAEELMTAWGVGNAACNDGVLLLLSKQPREACTPAQPPSHFASLVSWDVATSVGYIVLCFLVLTMRSVDNIACQACYSMGAQPAAWMGLFAAPAAYVQRKMCPIIPADTVVP